MNTEQIKELIGKGKTKEALDAALLFANQHNKNEICYKITLLNIRYVNICCISKI